MAHIDLVALQQRLAQPPVPTTTSCADSVCWIR